MVIFEISLSQARSTLGSGLKKSVLVKDDSDFSAFQKFFCSSPWHEICVWKLLYDHMFLSKQTGWLYDTLIRFYSHKRKQMVIFGNSYSQSMAELAIWNREYHGESEFFIFRWLQKIFEVCYQQIVENLSGQWLGEAPAQRVWSKTQYSSKYRQKAIPPQI